MQLQRFATGDSVVVVDSVCMAEKRGAYRAKQGLGEIRVSMALGSDTYIAAKLIDLSAKGAAVAVSVPAARVATLPTGTRILLRFEVAGIDAIPDIAAVVRNERDGEGARVFGLEIVDWKVLHSRLPARLFSTFNRRKHYRVSLPTDPATIGTLLLESGQTYSVTLTNISAGGCLVSSPLDAAPNQGETLQVNFSLPGSDHCFDIRGSVKSASEVDSAMLCGIEFDAKSPGFPVDQQQISLYVVNRQRELKTVGQVLPAANSGAR